jgi:signal peptidase
VLTLVDADVELRLDDPLDDLEARLDDVKARLDEIARALAAPVVVLPEPAPVVVEVPAVAPFATLPDDAAMRSWASGDSLALVELPFADPGDDVVAGVPAVGRPWRRRLVGVAMTLPLIVVGAIFAVCSLPALAGYRVLVVNGSSMEPTVPLGSVAFTRLHDAADVEVGDVILVNPDSDLKARFLHRVEQVRVRDGQTLARTRGDANADVDPEWVVLNHAVPTLVTSVPAIGYVMAALTTPLGWAALVLGPAALVCARLLRDIWAAPDAPAAPDTPKAPAPAAA